MAPYFLNNLVPRRETRAHSRPLLVAVATITWIQWAMFLSGCVQISSGKTRAPLLTDHFRLLAWICDAFDFFSVSLSVTNLGIQFGQSSSTIVIASFFSSHIMLTTIQTRRLLSHSRYFSVLLALCVSSLCVRLLTLYSCIYQVIFGILSDRYGRKWPLVYNLILIAILELGAGFVQTFSQFLALRSLFGIGMGGIWGLAAATALENLPVEVRGVASGILQQGYAVGYLFAAIVNLFLVPEVSAGWRALFWTGSGISLFSAAIRALLPESEIFLKAKEAERARGTDTSHKTKIFIHETKVMLKKHWLLCIYAVLLMTGMFFVIYCSLPRTF